MIPSQYEDLSVIWWVGPCWSHEWHDEQQWTSCPAGQWLWGSHGWSVTRIWEKLYSISVSNALQSMNQHDFDMFWFEQNSTWFAIIVCSYMLTFTRFWCNCETPIPPKKENSTCVAPDHKPCVAPDQNEHGLSWSNYHNVHSFSSCSMFLYMFSMEPSHSARTFPWQSVASHQKKKHTSHIYQPRYISPAELRTARLWHVRREQLDHLPQCRYKVGPLSDVCWCINPPFSIVLCCTNNCHKA